MDSHCLVNPMWIAGYIGLQMFIYTLFIILNLSLPSSIPQTRWIGTTRLVNNIWYHRSCGLPPIPTSDWIQLSLVRWWLICGRRAVIYSLAETRIRTWVLGCLKKNCMGSRWTSRSQAFNQMMCWETYHFGATSIRGRIFLFVVDGPVSGQWQVSDFR